MRFSPLFRSAPIVAALLLTAGCASGQSSLGSPAPEMALSRRPSIISLGRVVSQVEIRNLQTGPTAFDVVRRLRPEFLGRHASPRPGGDDDGFAQVYLDNQLLGGLETLRNILSSKIIEVRYLPASAAAQWFGRDHRGGVIVVKTIR